MPVPNNLEAEYYRKRSHTRLARFEVSRAYLYVDVSVEEQWIIATNVIVQAPVTPTVPTVSGSSITA